MNTVEHVYRQMSTTTLLEIRADLERDQSDPARVILIDLELQQRSAFVEPPRPGGERRATVGWFGDGER